VTLHIEQPAFEETMSIDRRVGMALLAFDKECSERTCHRVVGSM
jgi:hypothetical protein